MASLARNIRTCCKCQLFIRNSIQRITPSVSATSCISVRKYSADPLPSSAERAKNGYPPHIVNIVDSISSLTLLEVSQLNQLLKTTLNIQDAPMMPMGGMVAQAAVEEEEEAGPPVEEQTEFNVKITEFDAATKVKLIKEVKAVMPDMNLVAAKKFIESLPQMVRENIPKEEADALKAQLEAVGAKIVIE